MPWRIPPVFCCDVSFTLSVFSLSLSVSLSLALSLTHMLCPGPHLQLPYPDPPPTRTFPNCARAGRMPALVSLLVKVVGAPQVWY